MIRKALKRAFLLFMVGVVWGANSDVIPVQSLRGESVPFSDRFPSITETLEMSKLSALVYDFKGRPDDYCSTFSNAQGIRCHWYFHDTVLGTQVLLVSSPRQKYLAIVFAGTDDLRTSLEDMDITKKSFGDNSTVHLDNPDIKVHQGFNNAVFSGVYTELEKRLKRLRIRYPIYKLYTTGHSLGAANSILTATALAEHAGYSVVSINFGCPKTGNREWRNFLNGTSTQNSRLAIWRIVMGWDLVARLPSFFNHVGHTIQLWSEDHYKYNEDEPDLVECYYRHCKYTSPLAHVEWIPVSMECRPIFFLTRIMFLIGPLSFLLM
jgi:Lipase (class 3)